MLDLGLLKSALENQEAEPAARVCHLNANKSKVTDGN